MASRVFRPVEDVGFGEWCEKYITLRKTETKDYDGPYSRRLVVAMARLWELFLDSDEWRMLSLAKGSQSTASLHALVGVVRQVAVDPCNVVYAIHSASEAGNIGRRLRHLLEDCPETAGVMSETDEDDKAAQALRLPGANIWLTGSGSAGAMASKPGVGLIVIDEVDKHPEIRGEASSIDLLRQRGKTVRDVKVAAFSTPTIETGQIWKAVKVGSRHKYYMPCPHCGEMQVMERENLKWGHLQDLGGGYDFAEVRKLAYYECSGCKGEIRNEHKESMILAGEWLPTNFREVETDDGEKRKVPNWQPGEMSALHNDFLAMWESSSIGDLALESIAAGNHPRKLHDLLNNRFGLPWREGGVAAVTEEHIFSLKGAYRRGTSRFEPAFVTFAADTQDDCWKWVICAWSENGDLCVADYGAAIAWGELMERARDGVEYRGKRYRCQFGLIDEGGHRTREVRRNVMPFRPWMFACKGLGGIQVRVTLDWRMFGVDREGIEKVPVLVFDDDCFKRELYRNYIFESARAEKRGRRFGGGKTVWFPADMSREFVEELCSERLEQQSNGRYKWEVVGANDFGDALKMNLIAHAAAGHMTKGVEVAEAKDNRS